jgi:peptidoglycan-associated lipoprotein
MRRNAWLTLALVMILPAMLFLVSCAKKTTVQSQPVQKPQVEVAEVPTVEETSDEVFEPVDLPDEAMAIDKNELEFVSEDIRFAFDSSELSAQARKILRSNAEYLSTNPGLTVTVEGHCDERGTDAYNMALGERRAQSVKDFLVNKGIRADRLHTVSYGEELPIALGRNEASWAKNRRAQLVINELADDHRSGMTTMTTKSWDGMPE